MKMSWLSCEIVSCHTIYAGLLIGISTLEGILILYL
jgi:hypothetical protein